jgi:flagellar biosynthesis protein FlhG
LDQAENLRLRVAGGKPLGTVLPEPLRVMAVTSGKGGVGKTMLTANLAVLGAKRGKRVLIIDADLGLANVEIVFGVKPKRHVGDLLNPDVAADDVLIEARPGIHILPAASGIQQLTQLGQDEKLRLIATLDGLAERFDLVLIDSGAGIGDNVLFFVGVAQEIVLVVTPEPTSLVDAYAAVKVLSQQVGIKDFGVVVNSVVDELVARDVFQKLVGLTDRFLSVRIRHLGYVTRDENVHRAVMAQKPITDLFAMAPASRALTLIADRLFKSAPPPMVDGGMKLMWHRLFREASVSR